jgi:cyclopropane fatty-acyl-phospholipid synthase-like methyltransferase
MNLNPIKFFATVWFRYQDWPRLRDRYDNTCKYYAKALEQNNRYSEKLSAAYDVIETLKKEA